MSSPIYFDYNATTPIADEVAAAMSRCLTGPYGNPSSVHWAGQPARDAVETARSQVAALLCCDATEVVFKSGGTEANNYALKGLFFAKRDRGRPIHVITSLIEHPAVLEPCSFLERLGLEVTRLRDEFWLALQALFGDQVVLNGHPTQRLPNTLNVSFRGRNGSEILAAMPNIAASTGSACHVATTHISPVLAAMEVSHDVALGAVRFSLGRETTRREIDAVVEMLIRITACTAIAQ